MKTIILGGQKITIRQLYKEDLKNAKQFRDFINSFVREDAQIMINKQCTLKEEEGWLKGKLDDVRKKKTVFLIAEHKNTIVGTTEIDLYIWRKNHIGNFGIIIKKDFRGIGLGACLIKEVIKLAKKQLRPKPKSIRLDVFSTNKPAIELYKKCGFRIVARVPKQIELKGKLVDEIIMLK